MTPNNIVEQEAKNILSILSNRQDYEQIPYDTRVKISKVLVKNTIKVKLMAKIEALKELEFPGIKFDAMTLFKMNLYRDGILEKLQQQLKDLE